jgi:hypothetical protein
MRTLSSNYLIFTSVFWHYLNTSKIADWHYNFKIPLVNLQTYLA